jgi:hypothetical protein
MKEPSIFTLIGLGLGFLFGAVVGFIGITQMAMDTYMNLGKSQISWRINQPSLERCVSFLRDRSFDTEQQWTACAYFIEQVIEAVQ